MAATSTPSNSDLPYRQWSLITISGPRALTLALDSPQQYTLGRRATHHLALDHPEVSKDHAAIELSQDGVSAGWVIVDVGSRHGTRVNGVRLEPQRKCPLVPGDLIEISPWTFSVVSGAEQAIHTSRINTVDDSVEGGSTIAAIQHAAAGELAQERLRLLLRCAEQVQTITDELQLADIALDIAVKGTGFANAAVTRPMSQEGEIEIVVSCGDIGNTGAAPRLSRSLMRAAGKGTPVQLMGSPHTVRQAVSIMEFGIQEAICVPLMMESTVAGFLYLDSRGMKHAGTIGANEACSFAVGVGRLASMAWANLKRLELERRYARMEGELSAAARAQQLILPRREGQCGALSYIGQCKPGRTISGDFFDVFELPQGRVAVTIGDVSGKGVAASVVMTTTQGFLHGALRQHGDVARAVHDLNGYVHGRCDVQMFVTLWAGVFDPAAGTLTYVDAGHGYVWRLAVEGAMTNLNMGGGPPIAVAPDSEYLPEIVNISAGDRVLMVSDGIIEQPSPMDATGGFYEFGSDRVETAIRGVARGQDEVAALFAAVQKHAATMELADDVTVVVVRC